MTKQGKRAATRLLPLLTGVLVAGTGCLSSYPELQQDIDQAVAAAQPDSGRRVASGGTVERTGAAPANATGTATPGASGTTSPGAAAATPLSGPPGATMTAAGGGASRVTTIANLPAPEAAVVDTAAGVILVAGSETVGSRTRGVIMQIDADGSVRDARWIVGGQGGVVLEAPRGMEIVADTLWVVDGTAIRAFNRKTGRRIATIGTRALGGVSLTDVVAGENGALYASDAAVTYTSRGVAQRQGSGKIFRVDGRTPSVALEHARLVQPTGLSWDPIMSRLLIGAAGNDTVLAWRPGQSSVETAAVGNGPWDDVIAIGGTTFYALNASRGEVVFFQNGAARRLIDDARGAGDMALDARRGRLLVPFPTENRVEIWDVRR